MEFIHLGIISSMDFANKNVFSAAFTTESVSAIKVDLTTLFVR